MNHNTTQISSAFILALVALTKETVKVNEKQAKKVIRRLVGDSPTFGDLKDIDSRAVERVLERLEDENVYVPASDISRYWKMFSLVATADERATTCEKCDKFAITRGVDGSFFFLSENNSCPHTGCDGLVKGKKQERLLVSWVTGHDVPSGQEYDLTSVPGTKIPLTRDGIYTFLATLGKGLPNEENPEQVLHLLVRNALKEQEIDIVDLLRYLNLHSHEGRQTRNPVLILQAMVNPATLGLTENRLRVLACEARNMETSPSSTNSNVVGNNTTVDQQALLTTLCKVLEGEMTGIISHMECRSVMPGETAPQGVKAVALLQWVNQKPEERLAKLVAKLRSMRLTIK